jgi:hypothetical protein
MCVRVGAHRASRDSKCAVGRTGGQAPVYKETLV